MDLKVGDTVYMFGDRMAIPVEAGYVFQITNMENIGYKPGYQLTLNNMWKNFSYNVVKINKTMEYLYGD